MRRGARSNGRPARERFYRNTFLLGGNIVKKALEGVRVLDFTQVLAGPFCTMNLADFGAEVIKIEKPGVGDGSRIFGPFKNGQSGYYTLVNRGKKGIAIDLKKGKDLIYDMVKSCDIVVENFKPGVMKKLGFSYEDLKQINPKIIYCSISGFGQDSPMRDLPAYDIVAQGMSGMMSITGYPDTPPARVGASLGDVSAGLYAVTGILLALYNRERTGEGQYVDVALLDSVFAFVETNVVRHTIGGIHPTRVGARHPLSAPFDIYMCKDTYVIIAVASDHHFAKLCELIGQPDLIKDPKFDSDPHRSANDVELKAILEKFFSNYTAAEAMKMMQDNSIPCGPLCTVDEACENPSILARKMLVEIDQPGMGKVKITGNPMKLSETPADPCHPAPAVGQDNETVLHDIFGYSDEQIAKWKEEKVL